MADLWQRLRRGLRKAGAANESDTQRDGAFSYSGEYHAVGVGIAVGLATVAPPKARRRIVQVVGLDGPPTAHLKDAATESAYTAFGLLLGIAAGLAAYGIGAWTLAKSGTLPI